MIVDYKAAFKPLRDALLPKGTENITHLFLGPAEFVDAALPQKAIDEIMKHQMMKDIGMEDGDSACMQIAKIVLMTSAYRY